MELVYLARDHLLWLRPEGEQPESFLAVTFGPPVAREGTTRPIRHRRSPDDLTPFYNLAHINLERNRTFSFQGPDPHPHVLSRKYFAASFAMRSVHQRA
jgi:hypothetical protein